jgi:hypothetical protein
MEQMPQIRPLIQGAFSHFCRPAWLQRTAAFDHFPARFGKLAVLHRDRYIAVAFYAGDMVDVDGAGRFHYLNSQDFATKARRHEESHKFNY